MFRVFQVLALLTLFFASSGRAAVVSQTAPNPAATSGVFLPLPALETTGAYEDAPPTGLEPRIGLLCHNDPVNHVDPDGLEPERVEPQDGITRGIVEDARDNSGNSLMRQRLSSALSRTDDGVKMGIQAGAEIATEYIVTRMIGGMFRPMAMKLHHANPKYLGGPEKQSYAVIPKFLHDLYHKGLDKIAPRWRGAEYYSKMPAAEKAKLLEKVSKYTGEFDKKHATDLLRTARRNGFAY